MEFLSTGLASASASIPPFVRACVRPQTSISLLTYSKMNEFKDTPSLKFHNRTDINSYAQFRKIITSQISSFCTNRLYGTYSEKRSKVVVLVARWTFSFLLIHNLVTMTNFAFSVIIRLDYEAGVVVFESSVFKAITITNNILDEIELILVVLSVPMSYLMGIWAQCCCGFTRGNDMEMDKGQDHDMFSRIFRKRIHEFFFIAKILCYIYFDS